MDAPPPLRLAELLAAMSLVGDLGMGLPPEDSMRAGVLATELARRMDVGDAVASDVYYAALIRDVGCTAAAHEAAALVGGDDIAMREATTRTDFARPGEAVSFIAHLAAGDPLLRRLRTVAAMLRGGRESEALVAATCEVGARLAERLGLPAGVIGCLRQLFERWDGKGGPEGLAGEAVALTARFVQVASQALVFHRLGGAEVAVEVVGRRAGSALDPAIAAAFVREGGELLSGLEGADAWAAVLAAEPAPARVAGEDRLDAVAAAFADMADLKALFLRGHSPAVAALAAAAAESLGLGAGRVTATRRAGLLHDLGRVGVPNGIWDRPGPLTEAEWERVRLHPYHTERILSRSPVLAGLAPIAGMHHERQDGSGYHRRLRGGAIPAEARILAAADAFQAMSSARPHRPAMAPPDAARALAAEAEAGRLDPDAAGAVLAAAGRAERPRRDWPAGLTDREVEVLRLIARGRSNRQVARALGISEKTAGNHVQHLYAKAGVSTRAGASLFAVEHGLLEGPPAAGT